jgi:hypothetical protein
MRFNQVSPVFRVGQGPLLLAPPSLNRHRAQSRELRQSSEFDVHVLFHRPKLTQLSHELFVAEIFIRYRANGLDVDGQWIGEDQFPKSWHRVSACADHHTVGGDVVVVGDWQGGSGVGHGVQPDEAVVCVVNLCRAPLASGPRSTAYSGSRAVGHEGAVDALGIHFDVNWGANWSGFCR